jgi:hypothetical protein
MIDRSSRIKNNLSEQLKLFYDYTKDIPTKVIKPNPLPASVYSMKYRMHKDKSTIDYFRPIFRIDTDVVPQRKPLPVRLSHLPPLFSDTNRFDLSTSSSKMQTCYSPTKEPTVITPSRDLAKLSLSLHVSMDAIVLVDNKSKCLSHWINVSLT